MSHHEVQIEIPKSQRSPTSSTTPKVIFSAGSPAQHKCLKTESTKGSKDGVEGIPMHVFSFADCVLAHSVSEGPAGRREILFQENDESPVKGPSRAQKEREMEKEKAMSPKPFMQLYKMESAPEIVSEVKEKTKSPSHAALESILNLILKEQGENDRKKQGISTPEKPRNLSSNLVNKFSGLQKGNSHNSSHISLHERSNSNLLSNDRTTEKSSRIYTEPPSKGHSRVGSWAKIQIDTETQPDIIWETTEIESGTIYRRRTSRLSADYSHLAKQFPDYPTKPVEQQDTPVLSPKRLNSEETSSPGKKSRGKVSPIKQQQTSKNHGSRIKHLQAKLFPVKPQSLNVKTTIARWPVA